MNILLEDKESLLRSNRSANILVEYVEVILINLVTLTHST